MNNCVAWLKNSFQSSVLAEENPGTRDAIRKLATEKYETWEWNFGYSPEYSFQVDFRTYNQICVYVIYVKNGYIYQVTPSELFTTNPLDALFKELTGLPHRESELSDFYQRFFPDFEQAGITDVEFLHQFFN
jgi:lipoate-protein ligase A